MKIETNEGSNINPQFRQMGSESGKSPPSAPTAPGPTPPSPQAAEKEIAAIIMPPATGKSFLVARGLPPNVREADDLCHVRETQLLSRLRDDAKNSGDWSEYDRLLADQLRSRCSDGDIILLASVELAEAMGAEILGTCVLRRDLWEANMRNRGQPVSKHEECYNRALQLVQSAANSYEELYSRLGELICAWSLYIIASRGGNNLESMIKLQEDLAKYNFN
jgi:hypothetical protein